MLGDIVTYMCHISLHGNTRLLYNKICHCVWGDYMALQVYCLLNNHNIKLPPFIHPIHKCITLLTVLHTIWHHNYIVTL
jgi:hypothetical protein